MGDTDEYPAWASPLLIRRMLWQEYGIPFRSADFKDVVQAIELGTLEREREANQARRHE